MSKENDLEYRDEVILSAEESQDGWTIALEDKSLFFVSKEWGVEPHPGDTARFYGKGVGSPVRGLDINGQECYYRTPEEEAKRHAQWVRDFEAKKRAEFEKNKATLDEQYQKLPEVFQRRIDKFRTNNPNFRWKYEAYEMFVCTEAVRIAEALKTANAIRRWKELEFDEQRRLVPNLSDDHSGNTFGASCFLALAYLEQPDIVVKQYGALAPLVGSEEYGCVPRAS